MKATITVSITYHGVSNRLSNHHISDDPIHTFQDDIVDLRRSASLFEINHASRLLSGECSLEFPKSVRIFSEGDDADVTSLRNQFDAHFIASVTTLPENSATLNISLDLKEVTITEDLLNSLNLIQKIWHPRELKGPPIVKIIDSDGPILLSDFAKKISTQLSDIEFKIDTGILPKVAVFIDCDPLFSQLVQAGETQKLSDFSDEMLSFSGLLQNVLDYREQDLSEVRYSLESAYRDDDIIIFSNLHQLVEVSRASRSFEEGRGFIGTCPYLYLLHVFLFHNEVILNRWAQSVADVYEKFSDIRGKISSQKGKSIQRNTKLEIRLIISEFVEIRLNVMTDIRSNSFPNNFRYETEKVAFKNCSSARNLDNISDYWIRVLENCEQSVNDLARLDDESRSLKLSYLVGALTIVTVSSSIIDLKQELVNLTPDFALPVAVTVIALIAAAAIWFLRKMH